MMLGTTMISRRMVVAPCWWGGVGVVKVVTVAQMGAKGAAEIVMAAAKIVVVAAEMVMAA